jgi:hypothetical protein
MGTEEPAVFANANFAIIARHPFLFVPTRWIENLTVTCDGLVSTMQQTRETYVMPICSKHNKAYTPCENDIGNQLGAAKALAILQPRLH